MTHDFDRLVWTGDINADFKRSTRFVKLISEFIFELDYVNHGINMKLISPTPTIDQFFWYSPTTDSIIDAGVLHLSQNLSDHSPVFCKMETPVESKQISSNYDANGKTNPCWKKATESERKSYYDNLHTRLKNLTVTACVLNCFDVHCTYASHKMEIDDLISQPIFFNSSKKNSYNPNWNSEFKFYRDKAQFWRAVWLSADRPQNGELHILMRRTRNIYHQKKLPA